LSQRNVYAGTGNEAEMRRKVILLSNTVDSLSISLQASEQFVTDFRKVMKADNADLRGDTSRMKNSVSKAKQDSTFQEKISPEDKKLRKEYEGTINMGANNGTSSNDANISLKDFYLFAPIKGLVTEKYNAKTKHYGVDIVCKKDEAVKNVADGTVIMASWTEDTGNVIALQHKSNLISIYKHNSVLL
jgi:murein DD-endopeptidase MepM/ murein hydrolase activator NlpD